jgi:preprotein translocase subunit YajC
MPSSEIIIQILAVCGVLAVAYVSLVRPQLRRQTTHQNFLASLRLGDQIVTRGGVVGQIVQIDSGPLIVVELCKSVCVRVLKTSIDDRFESASEAISA